MDEELDKHFKHVEAKVKAYQYLGTEDRHLINILHWIKILDDLYCEVRESEMDVEMEEELERLIGRLTNEVGVRMVLLFP